MENDLKVDAEKFLAHYKKTGWLDRNGNQIQDWKAAAICWSLNETGRKSFAAKKKNEAKEPPSFNLEELEKRMAESDDVI